MGETSWSIDGQDMYWSAPRGPKKKEEMCRFFGQQLLVVGLSGRCPETGLGEINTISSKPTSGQHRSSRQGNFRFPVIRSELISKTEVGCRRFEGKLG
jgi:hypothetical protein